MCETRGLTRTGTLSEGDVVFKIHIGRGHLCVVVCFLQKTKRGDKANLVRSILATSHVSN